MFKVTCNDGICQKVYVGARTAGDIFDATGKIVTGAVMVLPQHVGVDMRGPAEASAAANRRHALQRAGLLADDIIRGYRR